jgi:hypothetical protein
MKRLSFISAFIFAASFAAFGQTNVRYLIFTSTPFVAGSSNEGIYKSCSGNSAIYTAPPIHFHFTSASRGIIWMESWINYNLTELAKHRAVMNRDTRERIEMPRAFLNQIQNQITDLDVLFPQWTKAQADAFFDSLYNYSKVYLIDRNDFFTKSPAIPYMVLYEAVQPAIY